MPQQLSQLEVREVSLVDKPANSSVDPLTGRKIPRARVALFKRDAVVKDDEGGEEPLEVLKGASMTLVDIEKKLNEQEIFIKKLTDTNALLEKERDMVVKMSKKQRRAYVSMSKADRENFLNGDTATQASMVTKAMNDLHETSVVSSMSDVQKAAFEKAGPTERMVMLQDQAKKLAKGDDAADEDDDPDDMDGDDDEKDKKDKKEKKLQKMKTERPAPKNTIEDGEVPDSTDAGECDEEGLYADADKRDNEVITLTKRLAQTTDRVIKAETTLAAVTKREQLTHFTKRAEDELPNTSGTPIEKGQYLMDLAMSLGGENNPLFKSTMDNLKNADRALNLHFGEVGKAGAEGMVPAERVFFAKVDEVAGKHNIKKSKAVEKVMSENPELYINYEREQRARLRGI